MSLESQIVDVSISLVAPATPKEGFSIIGILGTHKRFPERVRSYGDLTGMVDDGFETSDMEYVAAARIMAQANAPTQFKVLRRDATGVDLTPTVQNSANYDIYVDGVMFRYTSDGTATTGEIEAGLTSAINTGYAIGGVSTSLKRFQISSVDYSARFIVGGKFKVSGSTGNNGTYTISSVEFSTHTYIYVNEAVPDATADGNIESHVAATDGTGVISLAHDSGGAFSFAGLSANLAASFTGVEAIATAIANIRLEDDVWYGLIATTRDITEQLSVMDSGASAGKLVAVAEDTSAAISTSPASDTTSLMAQAKSAAHPGIVIYSVTADGSVNDDFPDAAALSVLFSAAPGSMTLAFKTLTGVAVDTLTDTNRTNVDGKRGNFYQLLGANNALLYGKISDATIGFADLKFGIDWLQSRIRNLIIAQLNANAKIPYTNKGASLVESVIRQACGEAVGNGFLVTLDSVTIPDVSTISASDRANRHLPGVKFAATAAGAVHTVKINGTVVV